MPRKGGWRREGSRGRFRYVDARGNRITDEEKLERIKSLVIPPAWKEVWITASASAKLQATGVDSAGRKQYLYHPSFRAQQEQEKFDGLIRFAEHLPDLRPLRPGGGLERGDQQIVQLVQRLRLRGAQQALGESGGFVRRSAHEERFPADAHG